jgi:hypothetical protein
MAVPIDDNTVSPGEAEGVRSNLPLVAHKGRVVHVVLYKHRPEIDFPVAT